MLLEGKNAIVYGAAGAIGRAVASAFAEEGARVFLAGRTKGPLEAVADKIRASGGTAHVATVDVLNADSVEEHADAVLDEAGTIDISFNAFSLPQAGLQGTRLIDLAPENFDLPLTTYPRAHFLTARAAGRRMSEQWSGVILTITASASRTATPCMGGMAPAWAAVESLSRGLAVELAPHGVRVVCINAAMLPENCGPDGTAKKSASDLAARRQLPTVSEIADVAVFVASDRASAMSGAIANVTGGLFVD